MEGRGERGRGEEGWRERMTRMEKEGEDAEEGRRRERLD